MILQDIKSELDNFDNYSKLVVRDPFSITTKALTSYCCKLMVNRGAYSIPGCLIKSKRWNQAEETEVSKKNFF